MQVRTKIQNLEKKMGSNSNAPILIKIEPSEDEWVEDVFKSKEAQDNYCKKIIELGAEEIESGREKIHIILIDLRDEEDIRKRINRYNLDPAVYLKEK